MMNEGRNELKRKHKLIDEEIPKRVQGKQKKEEKTSSKYMCRNKILQALSVGDKKQYVKLTDIIANEPEDILGKYMVEALTLATMLKIEIKCDNENDAHTERMELRLLDPKIAAKLKEAAKKEKAKNCANGDEDNNAKEEKKDEENGDGDEDEDDEDDDVEYVEDDNDDDDDENNGDSVKEAKKEGEPNGNGDKDKDDKDKPKKDAKDAKKEGEPDDKDKATDVSAGGETPKI